MKKEFLYLLIILLPLSWACSKDDLPDLDDEEEQVDPDDEEEPGDDGKVDWNKVADASSNALAAEFWNSGGGYFNTNNSGNTNFQYWPNAHGLDVLIDAYERTGDVYYKNRFDQWFVGVKARNSNTWYNVYYDDMEWNALALLRAYKATGNTKFKDAALEIWGYIKQGWSEDAGGGLFWKKGETSKNACSNGPAAILAARLFQEFGDIEDREWALRIYNWQNSILVDPNTGAVWDHINTQTGAIQKGWIFTYNQGTHLGAAVELYKIFGEKSFLDAAVRTANYSISALVENSVLKSEGTGDGGLFKGVFVRYFAQLIQEDDLGERDKKRYLEFIEYNAETLWKEGTRKPATLFGPYWREEPGSNTGLTEQLSGCMLIEAIALLEKKGLLDDQ